MSSSLITPTLLFRFSVPCQYREKLWSAAGAQLDEACRLPSFGVLESRKPFADVRAAWNEEGVAFAVQVTGKQQPLWCRDSRIEDSDGVQVWIDTRDTHNVHRASRFCHRFALLPSGGGPRLAEPVVSLLAINRARESPKPIPAGSVKIRAEQRTDGYRLEAYLTAAVLTGFDHAEHPRLGFSYAVIDRELGWQTFTVGPELPFVEDPSLWGTLELKQ